jgi:hypothetical protein
VLAIEGEARDGDLDDEHRVDRMRGTEIANATAHDRHVGLGLGCIIECDRRLRANGPALAEGARERLLDEHDRGVVQRALRLGHEQQAVDQLDSIAGLEHAPVHESLVLDTPPALELGHRSRHEPV